MNINVSRRQTIGGLAVAALLAGLVAVGLSNPLPADDPPAPKADDFSPYVTKDGGISLPLDYREKFLHLGTYAVATKPDKPVDEMHNVYARPEDIQAYRRDGKFPDGAILVKDVTTVGSEKLTTGQSTWTKDIKIWFVMVNGLDLGQARATVELQGEVPAPGLVGGGHEAGQAGGRDAQRLRATGRHPGVPPGRQVPRRCHPGEGHHHRRLGEAHHGAVHLD
jgi:hypothetical protein